MGLSQIRLVECSWLLRLYIGDYCILFLLGASSFSLWQLWQTILNLLGTRGAGCGAGRCRAGAEGAGKSMGAWDRPGYFLGGTGSPKTKTLKTVVYTKGMCTFDHWIESLRGTCTLSSSSTCSNELRSTEDWPETKGGTLLGTDFCSMETDHQLIRGGESLLQNPVNSGSSQPPPLHLYASPCRVVPPIYLNYARLRDTDTPGTPNIM